MTAHERERLAAWLDDELAPAERAEVEAHLAACAECAALLADMEGVDALARGVPVEAPPGYFETFPARVRARIEGVPRGSAARPRSPTGRRMPVWTWAAAAALLLGVLTPLTLHRLKDVPPAAPSVGAPGEAGRGGTPSPAREEKARDEAVPAERDRAPEVREKREGGALRPREDRADAPRPAFADAPEPRPIAVGTSAPRTPRPSSAGEGPAPAAADVVAPGLGAAAPDAEGEARWRAEGAARDEAVGASGVRNQVAEEDVATREVTVGAAAATVAAPAKGRAAAPQATPHQEGLASTEKKVVAGDSRAFARLVRVRPSDADAWREHRDEWRAFVEAHPRSPHADEARVRTIEAGLEAWKAGDDPEDLSRARDDAAAYLARDDAAQKERVRRTLEDAPESPR